MKHVQAYQIFEYSQFCFALLPCGKGPNKLVLYFGQSGHIVSVGLFPWLGQDLWLEVGWFGHPGDRVLRGLSSRMLQLVECARLNLGIILADDE